jgi:hypothetical protein
MYWPGGSFLSPGVPRPEKPREMIAIRYSPFRLKYRALRTNQDCQSRESNSDPSPINTSPKSCKATANGANLRKLQMYAF